MGHGDIDTPHRFLTFGRSDGDPAVAPDDDRGVGHTLEGAEFGLALVEQPVGVVGQQFAVHAFDVGRRLLDVGAYHAVPVAPVYQLYPGHVDLYKGGAAPLAGFEQDEANGAVGGAHGFEHAQYAALRPVEPEGYVVGPQFVLDAHETVCPEFEVVANAHPYPLPPQRQEGRDVALVVALAVGWQRAAFAGRVDPLLPQIAREAARLCKLLD